MAVGENQATLRVAHTSRPTPGRFVSRLGPGRSLLLGLPAFLAVGYLILLLTDFNAVISGINTYGDTVIAPVLGKLAAQAPQGTHILLGHHAYYEEYLFLRATAGLPFYRGLWQVAPMLWTLVGFGLLAWTAWRTLGRFAALLTASAVVCLGSFGQFAFFSLNWHGLTVLHTIVIGAALVWLAPRAQRISWPRLTLLAGGLGLISVPAAASDPLFLEWALVPMGLATALMARRSTGRARWTLGAFALATALVALLGGAALASVMRADGVGASPFSYPLLASVAGIIAHLGTLFQGFTVPGGGFFFRMSPNLTGFMTLLSGVFILAALLAGFVEGVRLTVRSQTRPGASRVSTATIGYVGFWLTSLIVQSIAFVVTGVPKDNVISARYLLAGYVAIMALLPLLARRGRTWRWGLVGAVCVFAASSIVQLARRPFVEYGAYPTAPIAQRVLAFARAHDVRYGYASYWQAPDLTWLTDFRLQIYPIGLDCGDFGICPWLGAEIQSWYTPRPGTRSMLILGQAPPVAAATADLVGRPEIITRIGTLTVAVYSHDIASELSAVRAAPSLPLDRAGRL